MPLLPIRLYDDPVLRGIARPILAIEPRHIQLADDMAETMYAARGIGLAANQIGLLERIIVVDTEWGSREGRASAPKNPLTMINPEILSASAEEDPYDEGCLSLPQIEGEVWRPRSIRVRYQRLDGEFVEVDADALFSRCIQHEIDHLNGILFIDHLDSESRQRLAGQLARVRKQRQAV